MKGVLSPLDLSRTTCQYWRYTGDKHDKDVSLVSILLPWPQIIPGFPNSVGKKVICKVVVAPGGSFIEGEALVEKLKALANYFNSP